MGICASTPKETEKKNDQPANTTHHQDATKDGGQVTKNQNTEKEAATTTKNTETKAETTAKTGDSKQETQEKSKGDTGAVKSSSRNEDPDSAERKTSKSKQQHQPLKLKVEGSDDENRTGKEEGDAKGKQEERPYSLSTSENITRLSAQLKTMQKYSPRDSSTDPRTPKTTDEHNGHEDEEDDGEGEDEDEDEDEYTGPLFDRQRGGDPNLPFDFLWSMKYLEMAISEVTPDEDVASDIISRLQQQWPLMDIHKVGLVTVDDLRRSLFALASGQEVDEMGDEALESIPEEVEETVQSMMQGTGDKGFFTIWDFTNMILAEQDCSIGPPYPDQFSDFDIAKAMDWIHMQVERGSSSELDETEVEELLSCIEERWEDLDINMKGYITHKEIRQFVWNTYTDMSETTEEQPAKFPEELENQVNSLAMAAGDKEFLTFWDFANINATAFGIPFVLQSLSA